VTGHPPLPHDFIVRLGALESPTSQYLFAAQSAVLRRSFIERSQTEFEILLNPEQAMVKQILAFVSGDVIPISPANFLKLKELATSFKPNFLCKNIDLFECALQWSVNQGRPIQVSSRSILWFSHWAFL
jgi:hypothetical protein